MLRIRLQRKGRKKRPIWHIVVAEKSYARDGRIVEQVGRYDNVTEKKEVILNEDRIMYWLDSGAQPTDTVSKILRREGILYKRHLINWGKSEEEVEKALAEWREYRDSKKEDATSRKEDYKAILDAEEKEYKKQLQEKAKKAAAEVEAEKAVAEAEETKKDDAPQSDADKIEAALEKAKEKPEKPAEESVEETAKAEEAAVEETQDESAETPVAEAEVKEEAKEEVQPEEAEAKEAAEAVEENVAEATEEPAVEEAKEETEEAEEETKDKDEEPAEEKEEEKAEETSGQVSTDMTAKEAIDHINDTDLADLKGFVPDDEDRVTVQRAWESKQEG
ncbi:MAG: 30S ribosomal protein S16 [Balneolaceae bacterium]